MQAREKPNDPPELVSWYAIQRGWTVISADGESAGAVTEVLGDTTLDIFNGLLISPGLGRAARYVPSELVGPIEQGAVVVTIPASEAVDLPASDEAP